VRHVSVILIDLPGLLRGIVGDLVEAAPGLRIAAEYKSRVDPVDAVNETGADFVIISARPGWEREVGRLVHRHPHARALGVAGDGRTGTVYELRPHARELRVLTPQVLREAIRARPDWTPAEQPST
jgi:hypothetical protein